MKRMLMATMVVVLLATPALQADDKEKDDAKSDHKLIQGNWKRVERHINGKVRSEDMITKFALQITKAEMVANFKVGDAEREVKIKYKLDPSKTPKHIDVTFERDGQSRTRKSIYLLEGDTLKICGKRESDERPTKIEAKEGDGQNIFVYKRVKEQDK